MNSSPCFVSMSHQILCTPTCKYRIHMGIARWGMYSSVTSSQSIQLHPQELQEQNICNHARPYTLQLYKLDTHLVLWWTFPRHHDMWHTCSAAHWRHNHSYSFHTVHLPCMQYVWHKNFTVMTYSQQYIRGCIKVLTYEYAWPSLPQLHWLSLSWLW